jgi:hypothetical protein
MPISLTDFSAHDQQIWDEELSDFVPRRVFDAQIHLFHPQHLDTSRSNSGNPWTTADLKVLQNWAARLYPDREVHFLALGTPIPGIDVRSHNQWCISQIQTDPMSRFHRLVTPKCHPDDIRRDVAQPGVVGLKPYRFFSVTGDAAQCRIHEFCPGFMAARTLRTFPTCRISQLKDIRESAGSWRTVREALRTGPFGRPSNGCGIFQTSGTTSPP